MACKNFINSNSLIVQDDPGKKLCYILINQKSSNNTNPRNTNYRDESSREPLFVMYVCFTDFCHFFPFHFRLFSSSPSRLAEIGHGAKQRSKMGRDGSDMEKSQPRTRITRVEYVPCIQRRVAFRSPLPD